MHKSLNEYREIKYPSITLGGKGKLFYGFRYSYLAGFFIMLIVWSPLAQFLFNELRTNTYFFSILLTLNVAGKAFASLLHELIHLLVAKWFRYKAYLVVNFFNEKYVTDIISGQYIWYWHNICIVAAPAVVLNALLICTFLWLPTGWLAFFVYSMLVLNVAGLGGDILNLLILAKYPGMVLYRSPDDNVLHAYIPQ